MLIRVKNNHLKYYTRWYADCSGTFTSEPIITCGLISGTSAAENNSVYDYIIFSSQRVKHHRNANHTEIEIVSK